MKVLVRRSLYGVISLIIFGGGFFVYTLLQPEPPAPISATVSEGDVQQIISVSGVVRAEDTARLGFPIAGVVESVMVRKGDMVATGTILATLDARSAQAGLKDAEARVARARATRTELLAGITSETRAVSTAAVALKQEALERTRINEAEKVANARRLLLSTELSAYSNDPDEDAVAPTITGTYTCDREGTYTIKVYRSGAQSGYSFTLTGLESGTYTASTDQAIAFGTCGLRAQFDSSSPYSGTTWYIDIPNKKSPSYTTNNNAYLLAQDTARSAIALSELELTLAQAEASNTTAPARSEAIARADADVAQAEADLARAIASADDRSLRAPFSGTVIETSLLPGETVTTEPVITLLSEGRYELTARVPEVDVSKLSIDMPAKVVFDTRSDLELEAVVDFISPNATTIDGVSYYETRLALRETPPWLRSGLNADIDIITAEYKNTLRLPTRFITNSDGVYQVLLENATGVATTTIEVLFIGNDGYYAITGIQNGAQVVAP